MIRRILLVAIALAAAGTPLAAQRPAGLNLPGGADPARPPLPRDADRNDWAAYYDHGVELLNRRSPGSAAAAFHWAARLDPSRAEPPYAMRVAIFMQDVTRWEHYLRDHPPTLRHPEMQRADSLMGEALLRNPFVPRSLDLVLYNQLPGHWGRDPYTRGWLALAQGDAEGAVRSFTRAVEARPSSHWRRMDLAHAMVAAGRMDEAAEQVQAVLAELRGRDERELVRVYESKEMLEYALGLLYLSRSRHAEAREALERAVLDNAAAYTAHRGLALLARAQRKPSTAAEEHGRAVEIAGEHPLLAYEYGVALVDARRPAEAVPLLARLVEREPHWAGAHLQLARAHDGAGSRAEALAAYERYLALAPRSAAATADNVRRRMERLRAMPAAPPAN